MRIRDLLLEDILSGDAAPLYDKGPGEPAFVVNEDGTSILLVTGPPRVYVPVVQGLDADATTLALIKVAAEQGSTGIEWSGTFLPVQGHFNDRGLPFDVILRHPDSPKLVPPQGVRTIESSGVDPDQFYCLTASELLGRRPVKPGVFAHGVHCPDGVGLLIFNPKGILTVFLEAGQRKFAIPPQA